MNTDNNPCTTPATDSNLGRYKICLRVKLNVQAINCVPQSHTVPTPNGSLCECKKGYIPFEDSDSSQLSCHIHCRADHGLTVSRSGDTCECSGNTYNTSLHGVILCRPAQWKSALDSTEFKLANAARTQGKECRQCPDECSVCQSGVATIKPGWRMNAKDVHQLQHFVDSPPLIKRPPVSAYALFAYRCTYDAYNQQDPACPRIHLGSKRVGVVGEENVTKSLSCGGHHTGDLCAVCKANYSRKVSDNSCVTCTDYDVWVSHFGLKLPYFLGVLGLGLALVTGLLVTLKDVLMTVKRGVNTNLKIILGLMQVISLLQSVLNIVFPPNLKVGGTTMRLWNALATIHTNVILHCSTRHRFSGCSQWILKECFNLIAGTLIGTTNG